MRKVGRLVARDGRGPERDGGDGVHDEDKERRRDLDGREASSDGREVEGRVALAS